MKSNPRLLIGLIVGGAAAIIFAIACAVVGVVVFANRTTTTESASAPTGPITREEFRAKYIGKTKAEIFAALGKPDLTFDSPPKECWHYRNITRDAISGKVDAVTDLYFDRDGRVASVHCF